jgi:hypothetical protein
MTKLGAFLNLRWPMKEGQRDDFNVVETATLTLLGLIIAFLLIADIDSPRTGFIHVAPKNLIDLAQSLPRSKRAQRSRIARQLHLRFFVRQREPTKQPARSPARCFSSSSL